MKRAILLTCATGLMTSAVAAQQAPGTVERRALTERAMQAGGIARTAIETRVTRGQPYVGEATTEFVQVLGDGNRIVRKTAAKLYRDSEGRTRRETLNEDGTAPDVNSVVITDPVAGSSWILDAGTRTAIKAPATFAKVVGGAISTPPVGTVTIARIGPGERADVTAAAGERQLAETEARLRVTERVAGALTTFTAGDGSIATAKGGDATREDLGEQMVEGVLAKGTRTATVIPAGAVGNEQPITISSEQWFSTELEVLVMTRHSDPRVGETVYRLTNIARHEPNRALFQPPADYVVKESPTGRPMIMRRQQ